MNNEQLKIGSRSNHRGYWLFTTLDSHGWADIIWSHPYLLETRDILKW